MMEFKGIDTEWKIISKNLEKGFYFIAQKDPTCKVDRNIHIATLDYGEHPDIGYLERAEANAKLIAAAPDLLNALQTYLNAGSKEQRRQASILAKKAIEKALK